MFINASHFFLGYQNHFNQCNNIQTSFNDGDTLNGNVSVFARQVTENGFNDSLRTEKKAVPSPDATSSHVELPNVPNIPPVSSFIKHSDALLHPSSPETSLPLDLVIAQNDVYSKSRDVSEIEQQSSISSSTRSIEQPLMESRHRNRSISLNADQSRFVSPSGVSISPTQLAHLSPSPLTQAKPFHVKSEVLEITELSKREWINRNIARPTIGVFRNENGVSNKFCSDAVTSTSLSDRVPTNGEVVKNVTVVPKQEKLYSPEHFTQYHCEQSLQNNVTYHPISQQLFGCPSNFPSVTQPCVTRSNHVFIPTQLQHQSPPQSHGVCSPGHLHLQDRHHPYMAGHSNFTAALNGTIPYRPRYSRRNNPDLEKKRIHKCDHPGN